MTRKDNKKKKDKHFLFIFLCERTNESKQFFFVNFFSDFQFNFIKTLYVIMDTMVLGKLNVDLVLLMKKTKMKTMSIVKQKRLQKVDFFEWNYLFSNPFSFLFLLSFFYQRSCTKEITKNVENEITKRKNEILSYFFLFLLFTTSLMFFLRYYNNISKTLSFFPSF